MPANQAWTRFLPLSIRSRLEGRPTLQSILSNTGWLLVDRILRLGVGLLVGVWIARYLGPEHLGLYSYAIAIVTLFSAIASLGLDNVVVRDIVRYPLQKEQILGTTFTLKLIGGSVAFLLSIGVITLLRPGDQLSQQIVAITAAGTLFQATDTIDYWFQSQVQAKLTVYAKITAFICTTLLKVILLIYSAPLILFVLAGLIETILSAVGLLTSYRLNKYRLLDWRASFSVAQKLLRDGFPLILSGIVIMVYMRIDQVMLAEQAGDYETGLYSAAVKLAEAWYFIPSAIVTSSFPSIIKVRQTSEASFCSRIQQLYRLVAALSYLVALPTILLSGWLIQITFGPAYTESAPILSILICSGLFVNLGVARSSFLIAMNWTRLHFMTVAIGCLTNIGLNYVLIPHYGGVGAAIATCISYWFATHGACFFYKPLLKTGVMLTKAMILIGN